MSKYDILKEALLARRQVMGVYHGLSRAFCPHALGWKNGLAHCWAYQFGGRSKSGTPRPGGVRNWRCFVVDDLSELEVRDGEWFSAPDRDRQQNCIDSIDVLLEADAASS